MHFYDKIKQSKAFMMKQTYQTQLFQKTQPLDHPHRAKQFNTLKLTNCFNPKTGPSYRNRQIRILQIGNACSTQANKKQVSSTKAKTPSSGLLNSQINKHDINSFFKLEKTKFDERNKEKKQQYQQRVYHTEKTKNMSPDKDSFDYQQYLSIIQSPKKAVLWLTKTKGIDAMPTALVQKHLENEERKKNIEDTDYVSRSANLINKIKIVDQLFEYKEEKRTFTNLQSKRKVKIESNRKTPQEIAEEERKAKLQIKKQISMDYAKPFNPPTNVSAYAYIVYEPEFSCKNRIKNYTIEAKLLESGFTEELKQQMTKKYPHSHKIVASSNSRNAVQVASLTKIMTLILALDICEAYSIDYSCQKITIGPFESNISGTSAQISPGQTYTLEDLFYGLMLPSGNDASIAIAVWGGKVLLSKEEKEELKVHKKKDCYKRYIQQMNNKGKQIGLQKSTYANSHGLMNSANKSCAFDLAVLCEYAMKNQKFKKIVSTKVYKTKITCTSKRPTSPNILHKRASNKNLPKQKIQPSKEDQTQEEVQVELDSNEDDRQLDHEQEFIVSDKVVQWENTHRLLHEKPQQYIGIKTGITTAAGPCLASCVRSKGNRFMIIIVLGCQKMWMRFKDTENLKKWAYSREGIQSPKKRRSQQKGVKEDQTQSRFTQQV